MNALVSLLLAAASVAASGSPAGPIAGNPVGASAAGRILPLRSIEQRIVPRMRGFTYMGPEFNRKTNIYRFKFLRGPKIVWVDVDARTGAVIGKSGF